MVLYVLAAHGTVHVAQPTAYRCSADNAARVWKDRFQDESGAGFDTVIGSAIDTAIANGMSTKNRFVCG